MSDDPTISIRGTVCVIADCIVCGVAFTVPAVVYRQQRESGGHHSCPNGHSQGWNKDGCENARLRRERDNLKQQMARVEDERRQAQQSEEAQRARAMKAESAAKRLAKRASAGTCPCCQRTFSNMGHHMKTKHPDFGAEVVPLRA